MGALSLQPGNPGRATVQKAPALSALSAPAARQAVKRAPVHGIGCAAEFHRGGHRGRCGRPVH